jgi:hypothetical protein
MWDQKRVVAAVEKIRDEALDKVTELAAQYRSEVLLPFCREHGLTFVTGNGTFIFFKGDQAVYTQLSLEDPELRLSEEMIEVLNTDAMTDNDCLAWHIEDITEEDLKTNA